MCHLRLRFRFVAVGEVDVALEGTTATFDVTNPDQQTIIGTCQTVSFQAALPDYFGGSYIQT